MHKSTPQIITLNEKKFIGIKQSMSITHDKTGELWKVFSPQINKIPNRVSNNKLCLQIYPSSYFTRFNPNSEFEKWALVEVQNLDNIPHKMETFTLEKGVYAVFYYKGSSTDKSIFQYIFTSWIPNSEYELDNRPHFEVLGERYKNNHPDSEEEIWIPVKKKI